MRVLSLISNRSFRFWRRVIVSKRLFSDCNESGVVREAALQTGVDRIRR